MRKVTIKVKGNRQSVEQFLSQLENNFALMLKSKIIPNNDSAGVHCFVDLDPFAVRNRGED